MRKPFLATLLVFDIQHDGSYDMPGCIVDAQCLPRPVGVHLILADPWSKEGGQPQLLTALLGVPIATIFDFLHPPQAAGPVYWKRSRIPILNGQTETPLPVNCDCHQPGCSV